jgi:hypothetical protein
MAYPQFVHTVRRIVHGGIKKYLTFKIGAVELKSKSPWQGPRRMI